MKFILRTNTGKTLVFEDRAGGQYDVRILDPEGKLEDSFLIEKAEIKRLAKAS